jgi:hypothetical protein
MKSNPKKMTAIWNYSLLFFHPSGELFEIRIKLHFFIPGLVLNEVLLKTVSFCTLLCIGAVYCIGKQHTLSRSQGCLLRRDGEREKRGGAEVGAEGRRDRGTEVGAEGGR